MKVTMGTVKLQIMVNKAMKCVSNNKMIPLTGLMAIRVVDGELSLITTDASNYLYIRDYFDGDDFYAVVPADIFSKLISKLSCETVELEVNNDVLIVKGNGKYSIELPLDEDGNRVRFPDPYESFNSGEQLVVQKYIFDLILNTAKASIATTYEVPCYTGYYVADKVVSTNIQELCGINIPVSDKPCLISASTMDLLGIMSEKEIDMTFSRDDEYSVMFETSDCVVCANLMDCIDDFQIDVISQLLDDEFESSCKLSKFKLLQLLDRLALFVSPYDDNGITLMFTDEGLLVESRQLSGAELIEYMGSTKQKDFKCCIDVGMFTSQIKAYTDDVVEIQYGKDNAIKLVNNKVIQVISLMTE